MQDDYQYAQMLSTAHRMLDGTEYISQTLGGRRIKRWKHPNSNMEGVLYKSFSHKSPQCKMGKRKCNPISIYV